MKLICCAALLFALLSSCAAADDEKCVEGHSYQKDCNTCTCTGGGIYACTLIACYHGPQFPDTPPITESAPVCTPGESKTEDCNKCRCTDDGLLWACTRMACPPKKIPINDPGYTCTAGAVFKEECNTCTCDSSGTLARCTSMACDPNERYKRSEPEEELTDNHTEKVCEPGASWMEDCNRCRCSISGTNAACTRMRCVPGKEIKHEGSAKTKRQVTDAEFTTRSRGGTKNQKKPIEDSSCVETAATTSVKGAPANNIPCNSRKSSSGVGTPVTEATKNTHSTVAPESASTISHNTEDIFESKTSTDSSHSGSTSSKPHPAPENEKTYTEAQYRAPDFSCTPSQSFKVDCNTCWCAVSGKTARYCTRIACKPKTYPPLEQQ